MKHISESIFKIASIFLTVKGIEGFIAFLAKAQSTIPGLDEDSRSSCDSAPFFK